MKRTDAELIEALEGMGRPWDEHFVLNDALVGFHDERGQLFVHLIEDDELNQQVCKFLARNGKTKDVGEKS